MKLLRPEIKQIGLYATKYSFGGTVELFLAYVCVCENAI